MSIATTREIHPLALRVPAMTDAEFAALKQDITENGLLRAITLYDDQVLDGRHRLRACEETGTEPLFDEYDGDSPATFVLSLNAKRRNLTPGQLAMLATDFLPDLEREAKVRSLANLKVGAELPTASPDAVGDGRPVRAADRAGELVGVSGVSVQRAKRVQNADPELAERVRQGEVTVNAANNQIIERERVKTEPTRDGSRKRSAEELVGRIVSKLLPTVAAFEHFEWREAINTDAPLTEWDKSLTEIIVPLYQIRGEIRKVLSDD